MRAVVQRVLEASLTINGTPGPKTGPGIVVLLGVDDRDEKFDADWLAGKIAGLRIFDDAQGVMNLAAAESGADLMVVSQFTLLASTKKGNRPSYHLAARPGKAEPLYQHFTAVLASQSGRPVATGVFGADMRISLINNGPVTIILDSHLRE